MLFHLKILLDIIFSGYNISPNRVHSTLSRTYYTLCISVRQPITEVKAEWNVAADVWEIGQEGVRESFKDRRLYLECCHSCSIFGQIFQGVDLGRVK